MKLARGDVFVHIALPDLRVHSRNPAFRFSTYNFFIPMKHQISFLLLIASLLLGMPRGSAAPVATDAASEKVFAANRAQAKKAWDEDIKTFGKDFADLEKEYQEINANYKSQQIKELLTKFIEKWKKGNRVGCATLYLAQKSGGELREKLLLQCAGEFSDAWYLDGTQVGGLGRLYLASHYKKAGKQDEVKKLVEEIRKDFATSQNHSREMIVDALKELE